MTKTLQIVRVLSEYVGPPERYYDLTELEWKDRSELIQSWKDRGFFVQTIYIDDLMIPRIELELAKRDEAARKEKDTK